MTKAEFLGVFLGFIVKKSETWLPEESTEENLLDVMQNRLKEHNDEIRKVLTRSNERDNITVGSNN